MSREIYSHAEKNRPFIQKGQRVRFDHEVGFGVKRLEGTCIDVWVHCVVVDLDDGSRYLADIRDDHVHPVVTA